MAKNHPNTLQQIIDADPGAQIVYWSGNLAYDCGLHQNSENGKAWDARADAWTAYERGFAYLVQQRTGAESVEYIAIRSSK